MNHKWRLWLLLTMSFGSLVGCAQSTMTSSIATPAIGYQPINPRTVWRTDRLSNDVFEKLVLESLPNETVQFSITQANATGSISFAPAAISVAGHSYAVVLDYMKYMTLNRYVRVDLQADGTHEATFVADEGVASANRFPVTLYVGVGMRVRADLIGLKGTASLASLWGVGLAAQANKVAGSISIYSLGLSGERVSAHLTVPTDLTISSIQGAVQDLTVLKTLMHEQEILLSPQILGFEVPISDPEIVTRISSLVSGARLLVHVKKGEGDVRYLYWGEDDPGE